MKQFFTLLIAVISLQIHAQTSYNSDNYAAVGDQFYLTSATDFTTDFVNTGTNYVWNFSTLSGNSQDSLLFRNPNTTGFVWAYIYNPNNTNLSSTKNETSSLSAFGQNLGITNVNSYFKKSESQLIQVASAYKIDYNGTQIPVTNQYTNTDVMYNFPIDFGDVDSDNSEFTIDIPSVYYQNKTTERNNVVDGWGSVSTPYGTFSNALRMTTTLIENDTLALLGIGIARVIRTTRDIKWFDVSQKYPVLVVNQTFAADTWTTTSVQYLDEKRDFQTTALFAYTPISPTVGASVYFQNMSTNADSYAWTFDDPASGDQNSSSEQHPSHVFNTEGTYSVHLTASNGTFTDEVTIPVIVGTSNLTLPNSPSSLAYPNPFGSKISVTGNINSNTEFQLITPTGQVLFEGKNLNQQDFSGLNSGVYILKIFYENETKTLKLVKQK